MKFKNDTINISCFGAIRPLKNHLSQALAAVHFAQQHGLKLRFHINATRPEQQGENILKNLRSMFENLPIHELVEHPWTDHRDFVRLIRDEIDLGMQVSYTETYNIVAADHVAAGVPVVTSSEVSFVMPLMHADPNSIPSMVTRLNWAWYGKLIGLHKINRWLLIRNNHQSQEAWHRNLTKLID
jgi:hypothetical protein